MLLCDISRQLLSHVSSTELMRTIHNLGTLVLVDDSWRDKMRGARTWEGLSLSFRVEFSFFVILICLLLTSSSLRYRRFIFLFFCVFVCNVFLVWVGCLFTVWLWCYPLVCPWLRSIDTCIAVLCHGWYRGVALCWCGETFFYLDLYLFSLFSLSLPLSFILLFLWYHLHPYLYSYIHLTLVFFHTTPPSFLSLYSNVFAPMTDILWGLTYKC